MSRRLSKASSKRAVEEPTVNLTPLIDVVFVILIMFIVMAPLLELDKIDLADASAGNMDRNNSVQDSSPIAIHVHKDNTIWFNKQKVSSSQLVALLKEAKLRHPKERPQLYHDRSGHFGTYQTVKNAAEVAGFNQLDVILKPN